MKNKQKQITPFANISLSVIGLIIFNCVIQFCLYPVINNYFNDNGQTFGIILSLLSILNIFAVSIGTGANNARITNLSLRESKNGDYIFFLIYSIVIILITTIASLLIYKMFTVWHVIFFFILMVLSLFRAYADVEYKLKVNFVGYLFFYLIISVGYVLGIFLFKWTGLWEIALIPGEAFCLIYVLITGSIFKKPFEKSDLYSKVLKVSTILAISEIIAALVFNCDRILIGIFLDGTSVTAYYAASLLGKVVALLVVPISGVLVSYLSKYKSGLTNKLWIAGSLLMTVICCILFAVLAYLSPFFIKLLYSDVYLIASSIVVPAVLAQIIFFASNLLLIVLVRFFKPSFQLIVNSIFAVLFIGGSCIVLPLWGLNAFCYFAIFANLFRFIGVICLGFISIKVVKQDVIPAEQKVLSPDEAIEKKHKRNNSLFKLSLYLIGVVILILVFALSNKNLNMVDFYGDFTQVQNLITYGINFNNLFHFNNSFGSLLYNIILYADIKFFSLSPSIFAFGNILLILIFYTVAFYFVTKNVDISNKLDVLLTIFGFLYFVPVFLVSSSSLMVDVKIGIFMFGIIIFSLYKIFKTKNNIYLVLIAICSLLSYSPLLLIVPVSILLYFIFSKKKFSKEMFIVLVTLVLINGICIGLYYQMFSSSTFTINSIYQTISTFAGAILYASPFRPSTFYQFVLFLIGLFIILLFVIFFIFYFYKKGFSSFIFNSIFLYSIFVFLIVCFTNFVSLQQSSYSFIYLLFLIPNIFFFGKAKKKILSLTSSNRIRIVLPLSFSPLLVLLLVVNFSLSFVNFNYIDKGTSSYSQYFFGLPISTDGWGTYMSFADEDDYVNANHFLSDNGIVDYSTMPVNQSYSSFKTAKPVFGTFDDGYNFWFSNRVGYDTYCSGELFHFQGLIPENCLPNTLSIYMNGNEVYSQTLTHQVVNITIDSSKFVGKEVALYFEMPSSYVYWDQGYYCCMVPQDFNFYSYSLSTNPLYSNLQSGNRLFGYSSGTDSNNYWLEKDSAVELFVSSGKFNFGLFVPEYFPTNSCSLYIGNDLIYDNLLVSPGYNSFSIPCSEYVSTNQLFRLSFNNSVFPTDYGYDDIRELTALIVSGDFISE